MRACTHPPTHPPTHTHTHTHTHTRHNAGAGRRDTGDNRPLGSQRDGGGGAGAAQGSRLHGARGARPRVCRCPVRVTCVCVCVCVCMYVCVYTTCQPMSGPRVRSERASLPSIPALPPSLSIHPCPPSLSLHASLLHSLSPSCQRPLGASLSSAACQPVAAHVRVCVCGGKRCEGARGCVCFGDWMHVVGDWMHVVAFVSASRVRFRCASRVWFRVASHVQFSFGFQIASRVRCVGDG
jgi:hypothetical protein